MVMRLSATSKECLLIALNDLRLQIKSIKSQTKLHVYWKHGFGLRIRGSSVCILDDLDNISTFLDEDSKLEEEITHLINEVSIFIFKFEKNITNQSLNILKTCTVIQINFERFQVCFLV